MPPNYNIRFNIITKFSIVLNKHISPWASPTPLSVVVINWGCSSPSDVSSKLPNSSIISSSESSLVASVSSSHISRAVTNDCTCPVFDQHVGQVVRFILSNVFPDFGRWWYFRYFSNSETVYLFNPPFTVSSSQLYLSQPFSFLSCTFNFLYFVRIFSRRLMPSTKSLSVAYHIEKFSIASLGWWWCVGGTN